MIEFSTTEKLYLKHLIEKEMEKIESRGEEGIEAELLHILNTIKKKVELTNQELKQIQLFQLFTK